VTAALLPTATLGGSRPAAAVGVGRWGLALVLALLGVVAGVGWLYTLRHAGILGHGPKVNGALPLQQLAGSDTQPAGRMIVAWAPVALATGLALAWSARLPRLARTAVAGLGAVVLLWLAGAESDAIAINQSFSDHVSQQSHRTGLWVASAIMAAGALVVPSRLPGRWGGTADAGREDVR